MLTTAVMMLMTQVGSASIGYDFMFRESLEVFVKDATRPYRLEQVIPHDEARLIRMLGCSNVDCRETATDLLRSYGERVERALIWGTMMRDAEIAERSRRLIDRLWCYQCRGSGLCCVCYGTHAILDDSGQTVRCLYMSYVTRPGMMNEVICVCLVCHGTGRSQPRNPAQYPYYDLIDGGNKH